MAKRSIKDLALDAKTLDGTPAVNFMAYKKTLIGVQNLDFNNINETGIYSIGNNGPIENFPPHSYNYGVLMVGNCAQFSFQIYFPHGTFEEGKSIWYRTKYISWLEWIRVANYEELPINTNNLNGELLNTTNMIANQDELRGGESLISSIIFLSTVTAIAEKGGKYEEEFERCFSCLLQTAFQICNTRLQRTHWRNCNRQSIYSKYSKLFIFWLWWSIRNSWVRFRSLSENIFNLRRKDVYKTKDTRLVWRRLVRLERSSNILTSRKEVVAL